MSLGRVLSNPTFGYTGGESQSSQFNPDRTGVPGKTPCCFENYGYVLRNLEVRLRISKSDFTYKVDLIILKETEKDVVCAEMSPPFGETSAAPCPDKDPKVTTTCRNRFTVANQNLDSTLWEPGQGEGFPELLGPQRDYRIELYFTWRRKHGEELSELEYPWDSHHYNYHDFPGKLCCECDNPCSWTYMVPWFTTPGPPPPSAGKCVNVGPYHHTNACSMRGQLKGSNNAERKETMEDLIDGLNADPDTPPPWSTPSRNGHVTGNAWKELIGSMMPNINNLMECYNVVTPDQDDGPGTVSENYGEVGMGGSCECSREGSPHGLGPTDDYLEIPFCVDGMHAEDGEIEHQWILTMDPGSGGKAC